MTHPGNDGIPQHAATTGLLASLPGRTIIQAVLTDILLSICLVIYDSVSSENLNWNLLWGLLVKDVLMTLASSIMKRVKPPPISAVQ